MYKYYLVFLFFFKQKTAYEMRISDWSSDVCSSDLADTRPDHVVKEEILQQIIDDGYQPILAVDDRPSVVAMWRSKGITTLQCAPDEPGSSIYAGQTLLHMLVGPCGAGKSRSEEHPSELQSLMRTSYAVLCVNKK